MLGLYPPAVPSTLSGLPEGLDATRVTLRAMVRYSRTAQTEVPIITLAREILAQSVPHSGTSKNYAAQLRALQNWVRDRIRYVRDPVGAEMVQTPERTLSVRAGDCDDKSVLLAALLMSCGFPCRFIAVGFKGGPPSHVFVESRVGTRWIPCETIVAGKEPGWYPENTTGRMEVHI